MRDRRAVPARPAPASRCARNSDSSIARPASSSAAGPGSRERNSSRRVNRQEGSSPITGSPPDSACSVRRASAARPIDQAGGEIGASAAKRPGAGGGDHGAVAGGGQHAQGGAQVLRLEIAVERVGQQQHVALRRGRRGGFLVAEHVPAPLRQAAFGGEAEPGFRQPAQRRQPVAQIEQRRQPGGPGGIARQFGHQPLARLHAVALGAGGQHLDLHLRHVHAGRAFAPAGLAGHAQRHRLGQRARTAIASAPSCPVSARRSVLARPRVRWISSRVTR